MNQPAKERAFLLTPAEAAARLGLKNPRTLALWRCAKRYPELRYVKVGRSVRYQASDVEAFIASRTVGVLPQE